MAGERGRILVVDDDDGLRELLVRYLSEYGYDATGVPDGAAMKRHLATAHVDLLARRDAAERRSFRARMARRARRSPCRRRRDRSHRGPRGRRDDYLRSRSATASCSRGRCVPAIRAARRWRRLRRRALRGRPRVATTANGEESGSGRSPLLEVLLEHPDRASRDARSTCAVIRARAVDRWSMCVDRLRRIEPIRHARSIWHRLGRGYCSRRGDARSRLMLPRTLFGRTALVIAPARSRSAFHHRRRHLFAPMPLGRRDERLCRADGRHGAVSRRTGRRAAGSRRASIANTAAGPDPPASA